MNTYYHNPNCTKSRLGLEKLKETNMDYVVKEYLKERLEEAELLNVFSKLGVSPAEMVRKKEAIYSELDLAGKNLSLEEWAQVIIKNPQLLERPILLTSEKAVIGRPPENLDEILRGC